MAHERVIENYLIDMDGVLVREERLIPGADRFIQALQDAGRRFLILTNNSLYTPRDLAARLATSGLRVPENAIWTAALATARFLDEQRPGGTAYVIGEAGLTTALHEMGYTRAEPGRDPPGDRLGRGPHLEGDGRRAVLRGQAEPADDARGAARDRGALGV